jgi:hypothetical protein
MIQEVIWLLKLKLMFAYEIVTSLAKGFPQTTDPIPSRSKISVRNPYVQRRRAGDNAESISQTMAANDAMVTVQNHVQDIA